MIERKLLSRKVSFIIVFILLSYLFFAYLLGPAEVQAQIQSTYYVDPVNGDDNNAGTSTAAAFKTITRAQSVVRNIRGNMTGDIYVYLRGGTYWLGDEVSFTESDSGTNGYNIYYQNYPGETPIVSGGVKLTSWTLHDSVKGIYKTSVSSSLRFRQLYVDNARAIRARWPNLTDTTTRGAYFLNGSMSGSAPYTLSVDASELSNWQNLNEVEVVMVSHWLQKRARISSYSVNGDRATISFQSPEKDSAIMHAAYQEGTPHYYENAYEFLDSEGEWYLDTHSNTLYYKPKSGESLSNIEVVAPNIDNLFSFRGSSGSDKVHNVVIKGISFKHSNWVKPSSIGYLNWQAGIALADGSIQPGAIYLKNASDIKIDSCNISKTGGQAILFEDIVKDCTISNNIISDTSGGGVYLMLHDIESSRNSVIRNMVEYGGLEYTDTVGILTDLLPYPTIQFNEIRYYRYSGMSVGLSWTDTDTPSQNADVGYNKIHDVMQLHDDGGGIYTLGNIPNGNIHDNYIYNVSGSAYDGGAPVAGIYLDNGSSYKTIRNNIIADSTNAFYAMNQPNHSNYFKDNYYNCSSGTIASNNIVSNNVYVSGVNWPSESQDIINNSGTGGTPTSTQTPGLKLWLKADAGITKDDNNRVSGWADQSGNENNASQSNSASQPLFVDNAANGRPALRFNGTTNYLPISGLTGISNTFTVAFVIKPSVMSDYNQQITAAGTWGEFAFHTNSAGGVYAGTSDTSRIEPGDGPGSGTVATNTWQQFTYVFNNGTAKLYKNGVLLATKSLSIPNSWTGFNIGTAYGSNSVEGDFAEVLVYDTSLSDSERQLVENNLSSKYGIGIQTSGLKLWLKADVGITKDGNDLVSGWADQSGNGNNASQSNSASQPLFVDNVANGKPVLRFNGTTNYLPISGLTGISNTFTVAFVIKPSAVRDYNQQITAAGTWGQFAFHTNSIGGVYAGTSDTSRIEPGDGPGSGTVATNTWQQFTYVFNNGTAKLYKNGVLLATKSLSIPNSWTGFNIGTAYGSNSVEGDFAELLVYDTALSEADRQSVENSLNTKYGIAIPIYGMKMWLKADAGITKDSNNRVSGWADQSGNGNNASQSNYSSKPLWVDNAVKGRPALRFNGTTDYLSVSSLTGINYAFTVSFVIKPSATRDYNQQITAAGTWGQFVFHTNSAGGVYVGTNTSSRIEPGDGPDSGTVATNTWQQFTYVFNNGTAKLYKNGVLLATKSLDIPGSWTGFNIGTTYGSNSVEGDFAEILVYKKALSDTDRQIVESNLKLKYGI